MSNPIAGYAVMPIVPSLRGLDAEINRQLTGSSAFTAAGRQAAAKMRSGFGSVDLVGDPKQMFSGLDAAAGGAGERVADALKGSGSKVKAAGAKLGGEAGDGILGGLDDLSGGIGGVFEDALADLPGGIATPALAAGAAAGALLVQGIGDAMENSRLEAKLQASLGASDSEAARLGKITGDLYVQNLGSSMEDVSTAVGKVSRTMKGLPGGDEIEDISKKALEMSYIFDEDLGMAVNAVSQMLRTGLAGSATEAFDVLTAGMQGPVNKSGDLLESFNEYSTQFRELGLSGAEALGLMSQGVEAGARDADVAGDALKEFAIKAQESSVTTREGFAALGMSWEEVQARFAQGGSSASSVLDDTLDTLRGIKDPAAQASIAVKLFGTQSEDMQNALLGMDLSTAVDQIGEVGGAADKASEDLSELGSNFEIVKRQLQQGIAFGAEEMLEPIANLFRGDIPAAAGEYAKDLLRVSILGPLSLLLPDIEDMIGGIFGGGDVDNSGLMGEISEIGGAAVTAGKGVERMGGSFDDTEGAADALSKSIEAMVNRTSLASLEFDAAAAGAAGFSAAMERSSSADNLLKAGLGVSSAMRDLRTGFFGEAEAADEAATKTDSLAEALDDLNNALSYTDPSLTKTEIGFGRLAAAASAFRESMSRNPIASQIGAALDLGEAYTGFSKIMRRLPGEIDMVDATMGNYRPRTMEAIRAMLDLGEAAQDYLATLLESGKSQAYVRGEADRLRNAYIEQLRAAGKTEAEIAKYIETLGLTPESVETAIRLSGVEGARFEIQSYLQLLEGRIPESIAASVTAKISSGNLEAAAQELASLAASNPVVIPVNVDSDELEKAKEELLRFPKELDPLGPIFGKYTEEEERGLEAILGLADQTKGALSEMVAAGRPDDEVIAVAGQLREQWRGVFGEMTGSNEAFDGYIEKLLGLDPKDIEVAIDMATFEADVFKVNALLGLLESDLSDDERFDVALKLRNGDIDDALGVLDAKITDWENEQDGLKVWADFNDANAATAAFIEGIVGTEVDVPVGAETSLAFEGVDSFFSDILSSFGFVNVAANMDPADKDVNTWRFGVAGTKTDTKIGANTDPAVGTIFNVLGNLPVFDVELRPVFTKGAFAGLPRFGIPGIATGGLISGPGTGTSDSILAAVSNGEYVIRAAAVRDIGVETLDRINAGQFDTLDRGELNTTGVAVTQADRSVSIDYTVIEAQEHPSPADIVRVVGTGLFSGGR